MFNMLLSILYVLNPPQESDITEKVAKDFHMEGDNSTLTDFDATSKDVEKATKL